MSQSPARSYPHEVARVHPREKKEQIEKSVPISLVAPVEREEHVAHRGRWKKKILE
jgi:hypothetical protein